MQGAAGKCRRGANFAMPLERFDMQGWDKTYAVNVRGAFLMCKLLVAQLEAGARASGRRSSIINVASIDGLRTPPMDTFAYSSGKAAVVHLSEVLAGKFGAEGRPVNVNAVCPGAFPSRMMRQTLIDAGDEAMRRGTAVGRIGTPEDAAGVALFLSSRAAEFVTGATLVFDGGALRLPRL